MLVLVVLGRRLLVEEGILGQLLLEVHGVDGRLRESTGKKIRCRVLMFYGKCIYSNICCLLSHKRTFGLVTWYMTINTVR